MFYGLIEGAIGAALGAFDHLDFSISLNLMVYSDWYWIRLLRSSCISFSLKQRLLHRNCIICYTLMLETDITLSS